MARNWLTSVVALWAMALGAAAERAPEFGRHPAEAALVGSPVAPSLTSAKARTFRTRLREAAAEGVNFNGHYKVTHWGQGTNVIEWAVIDLQTGAVWFAPDIAGSCRTDGAEVAPEWMEAHPDSALLYLYEYLGGIAGARRSRDRLRLDRFRANRLQLRPDGVPSRR